MDTLEKIEERHDEINEIAKIVQALNTKLTKRIELDNQIEELQTLLPIGWDAESEEKEYLFGYGAVHKYVSGLNNKVQSLRNHLKKQRKALKRGDV